MRSFNPILIANLCLASAAPALAQNTSNAETDIEEISVTATRTERPLIEVPASVTIQDVTDLRRNGFTVGTDEFRGVTGVFFRRGEGDADEFPFVSFRGSVGTEGSVSLVDGIPVIGLFEEVQLNEIPYDAIERIEIVKGPVSALYGRGALYGATNYITRRPREDANHIAVSAGSDDYYRVSGTIERNFNDKGGLILSASYEDYEGWREHAERQIMNLFGKFNYSLSDATELSLYVNYNQRDSELPNGRPLGDQGEILPFTGGDKGFIGFGDPNNDTRNFLAALSLEHQVNDAFSFNVRGSYRNVQRDVFLNFFDPFARFLDSGIVGYNGFRGDTSQKVYYGETTLRWTSGNHDIVAGITAEHSDSQELNLWTGQNGFTFECGFAFYAVEVDYNTGAVLNQNHPCFMVDDPLVNNNIDNTFFGAFIQDEITLAERLRLTVGLRYDDFSRDATFLPINGVTSGGDQSGDADAFSPKATLSYLTDWGQVYVAYGRGFNSNFGASFEWDPNQYLRPEARPTKIDSLELGLKGRFLEDKLSVEAIVFASEQSDRRQIVNNPAAATDFTQPFNLVTFGDKFKSHGLEFSMIAALTETTNFRLNYTYIDAEWDEFIVDSFDGPIDFSGNTPVGVPDHILYMQLDQQVNDWISLRGIFEHYADYYYTVDNAFEDGGYSLFTFGARLTPELFNGFAIDVTLNNAFGEDYYSYFGNRSTPTYAVPGTPRQLRVSLSGSF